MNDLAGKVVSHAPAAEGVSGAGTLEGKVALVTGSGRGIGRAIALKLAGQGAHLVVNDIDSEPALAIVDEIVAAGGTAISCPGSVSAPDFGTRFVETALDRFGDLDIIVNNAGFAWDAAIQRMTDEQWDAVLDVHLTAPFRILRAAQPAIRSLVAADRDAGVRRVRKVVNVSSLAGLLGNPGQVNYAVAKAGIVGMTKTLAKEWGRLNTTVNAVAYGLISTRLTASSSTVDIDGQAVKLGLSDDQVVQIEKMIPMGRAGTPDEAAGAAYLFCIPESDYVSGQVLACSGGVTGG